MKIGLMYISNLESSKIVNSVMNNYKNDTEINKEELEVGRVQANLGKNYGPNKRFDEISYFDVVYILREELEDLSKLGIIVNPRMSNLQIGNTLLSVRVKLYTKEEIMNPLPERPKFILLDSIKSTYEI